MPPLLQSTEATKFDYTATGRLRFRTHTPEENSNVRKLGCTPSTFSFCTNPETVDVRTLITNLIESVSYTTLREICQGLDYSLDIHTVEEVTEALIRDAERFAGSSCIFALNDYVRSKPATN